MLLAFVLVKTIRCQSPSVDLYQRSYHLHRRGEGLFQALESFISFVHHQTPPPHPCTDFDVP